MIVVYIQRIRIIMYVKTGGSSYYHCTQKTTYCSIHTVYTDFIWSAADNMYISGVCVLTVPCVSKGSF